jgi:hypothetical protein
VLCDGDPHNQWEVVILAQAGVHTSLQVQDVSVRSCPTCGKGRGLKKTVDVETLKGGGVVHVTGRRINGKPGFGHWWEGWLPAWSEGAGLKLLKLLKERELLVFI